METEIIVKEQGQEETLLSYNAYADDRKKTFFITPANRKPFKEAILLFKLGCVKSTKPINLLNTSIPVIGTVLSDIYGIVLEVKSVEWA